MSMFQQPSQGDKVDLNELVGSLVLFFVHDVRQGINTPYGEKEAVACDVHVLDGAKAGEIFQDCLIFQGGLIGSLRRAAGSEPVLARISQGVSKPGQKPPFILTEYTPSEAYIAEAYLADRAKRFTGTGPTTTAPGAAPAPAATAPAVSPAPGNGGVDYSALPQEVQELLRQSGAMPAA